jgi:hypothetical protein
MRAVLVLALIAVLGCDVRLHSTDRVEVGRIKEVIKRGERLAAVHVDIGAGAVHVTKSPDEQIHVDLAVHLRKDRAATDYQPDLAAHLAHSEKDGVIAFTDVHRGTRDANDWELRVRLAIPEGIDVHAKVSAGRISIDMPATNDVDADVDSGDLNVKVAKLAGACRVKVHAGEIRVAIADQGPSGGLDAEVGTGAVAVILPHTARGTFDLETAVGGITVDTRYGLEVERKVTTARVRGVAGAGGPVHRVRVGTGQITLQ